MSFTPRPDNHFRAWTVGLYRGTAPWALTPLYTPVFGAHQVTEPPSFFTADPFMIHRDGLWHLFMEILPLASRKGVIAHAWSRDLEAWSYGGVVLEEDFHLSYPQLVEWEGQVYMIPESGAGGGVRLYRADPFPGEFQYQGFLLRGTWADPTVFYFQDRWWMFACATPQAHDSLHLFWAKALTGPWHSHPLNPLRCKDPGASRPGGSVRIIGGRPIRPTQDCRERYGGRLRLFEICTLTPEDYQERELDPSFLPAVKANSWNAEGMHHIDLHQLGETDWVACVDGATWQPYP